jgi:hypothetical protein
MGDSHIHSSEGPVDLLTTAREWLWRHSSQPSGDPWDGAPEHLDRAALAQRSCSVAQRLGHAAHGLTHIPLSPAAQHPSPRPR